MKPYVTVGLTVIAGAALLEVALIPGLVIGGAAVLVPEYLPKLRQRLQPVFDLIVGQSNEPASRVKRTVSVEPPAPLPDRMGAKLPPALPRFAIKQAAAKTITFRVIVTTLDFSTNYVVLGEFATAAGLSTVSLIAGPLFYFVHETAWNYFGPSGTAVDLPALPLVRTAANAPPPDREGFTISRALAKTVTFRTAATVMDFTTNYLVIRDLATAVGLTAFGFVLGPFVYIGHEMLWDRYGSHSEATPLLSPPADLLAAGSA